MESLRCVKSPVKLIVPSLLKSLVTWLTFPCNVRAIGSRCKRRMSDRIFKVEGHVSFVEASSSGIGVYLESGNRAFNFVIVFRVISEMDRTGRPRGGDIRHVQIGCHMCARKRSLACRLHLRAALCVAVRAPREKLYTYLHSRFHSQLWHWRSYLESRRIC